VGRDYAHRLIPTLGLHHAGHLGGTELEEIVRSVPEGIHELVSHPGYTVPDLETRYRWGYEWSEETIALTSLSASEIAALGVEVVGFE
jgi:hypothetical protein